MGSTKKQSTSLKQEPVHKDLCPDMRGTHLPWLFSKSPRPPKDLSNRVYTRNCVIYLNLEGPFFPKYVSVFVFSVNCKNYTAKLKPSNFLINLFYFLSVLWI